MQEKDTIVYNIGDNLYVNLTNRCSNNCDFCVRNHMERYDGYYLWLKEEHGAAEIIEELSKYDLGKYGEVVFCGFGEPIYRYDVIKKVADYVHSRGCRTRINTNGQADGILGIDITADIAKYLDTINVSLNASDAQKYDADCHSEFGAKAYDMLVDFAKRCKANGANVVLSVVDCIGEEEVRACKALADGLGIPLRVREML